MPGESAISEAGASSHAPSIPDLSCYHRLRELALRDDLSEPQREAIRAGLGEALESHIRHLVTALDALSGPDAEMALVYALDAISSFRGTLTALDARLAR